MSEHYIYCYTNIKNNMQYIGQTIKHREYARRYEHMTDNNNGYFENEYQKHPEDFEYKIIATAPSQIIANELEKMYIRIWKTKKPDGYNLTDGGGGISGYELSEERKQEIGLRSKAFWDSNEGEKRKKIQSLESKAYWNSNKGEERKKIQSLEMSGKNNYFYDKHFIGELNPFYGKSHSDKSKYLISLHHADVNGANNPRAYSVICHTGEVFDTQVEAKKFANVSSISNAVNGKAEHAGKHPITGEKLKWYKLDSEEGQEIYKQFYND